MTVSAKHGGSKTICTGLLVLAMLGGVLLHAGLAPPPLVVPEMVMRSVHVPESGGNPSSQKDLSPNSAPELSCRVMAIDDPA